jgi:hypothetical protein
MNEDNSAKPIQQLLYDHATHGASGDSNSAND